MIDFDKFIVDEMDSNKEEIEPLYRIYASEMDEMIEQLNSASTSNDSEAYKRLLHNVKGINANMRIDVLTNPVAEVYQALLAGETIDMESSTDNISSIFAKVKAEIFEYFGD